MYTPFTVLPHQILAAPGAWTLDCTYKFLAAPSTEQRTAPMNSWLHLCLDK